MQIVYKTQLNIYIYFTFRSKNKNVHLQVNKVVENNFADKKEVT